MTMLRDRQGRSGSVPHPAASVRPEAVTHRTHGCRTAVRQLRHLTSGIALLLVLTACGGEDIRDEAGRVVNPGPWSVFDLRPGDCIGDVSDLAGDTAELPLVPCETPHTQEVYAIAVHPDEAYPGAGAVAAFADRACLTALDAVPGLTVDGGIAFSYLLPTSVGWDRNGDRSIVCVLVSPDGTDMFGSFVEGTARTG